jgi:hypothetical protein
MNGEIDILETANIQDPSSPDTSAIMALHTTEGCTMQSV